MAGGISVPAVAPNGTHRPGTRTYTIYLSPAASQLSGSGDCTLYFETNGGSRIAALQTGSGTTVDLTAYTPTRSGYVFTGWYADKALTEKITKVKLTGNTTVYAGWQEAASPFTDVPKGSYYEEAVNWAVAQGITTGTTATTFSPYSTCTRAQIIAFLWRAAENSTLYVTEWIDDVDAGDWFFSAVRWAVQEGMIPNSGKFYPYKPCTRAATVEFMWKAAGSPSYDVSKLPFTDVKASASYAQAVAWALDKGVTTGTTATTFSPNATCTRAQIATLLYRAFA